MDGEKFFDDDGPKALALDGSEKKHALLGENLIGFPWGQESLKAQLENIETNRLIGREPIRFNPDPILLVEGGPDFLAACWLAYAATGIPGAPFWIPLGFLGSTCNFTPEQLAKLSGRTVRIFAHHDPKSGAGESAANRWADALTGAGCTVEMIPIGDLAQTQPDGRPVEDLNDAIAAQSNLTQFAKEATEL
jgi:hypothetical protein